MGECERFGAEDGAVRGIETIAPRFAARAVVACRARADFVGSVERDARAMKAVSYSSILRRGKGLLGRTLNSVLHA